MAPLDISQYDDSLFDTFDINLPPQICSAIEKRKAEFLAGRILANRGLAALGQHPAQIPIGPNRAPDWPKGVSGAISHTKKFCACLVSNAPNLSAGVDIEAELSENAKRSVFRMVLNEEEVKLLDALEIPSSMALAAAFSAKETIYKALFPQVGRFFGFDAARLKTIDENQFSLVLSRDLAPDLPKGKRILVNLHLVQGHVLTWLLHERS